MAKGALKFVANYIPMPEGTCAPNTASRVTTVMALIIRWFTALVVVWYVLGLGKAWYARTRNRNHVESGVGHSDPSASGVEETRLAPSLREGAAREQNLRPSSRNAPTACRLVVREAAHRHSGGSSPVQRSSELGLDMECQLRKLNQAIPVAIAMMQGIHERPGEDAVAVIALEGRLA